MDTKNAVIDLSYSDAEDNGVTVAPPQSPRSDAAPRPTVQNSESDSDLPVSPSASSRKRRRQRRLVKRSPALERAGDGQASVRSPAADGTLAASLISGARSGDRLPAPEEMYGAAGRKLVEDLVARLGASGEVGGIDDWDSTFGSKPEDGEESGFPCQLQLMHTFDDFVNRGKPPGSLASEHWGLRSPWSIGPLGVQFCLLTYPHGDFRCSGHTSVYIESNITSRIVLPCRMRFFAVRHTMCDVAPKPAVPDSQPPKRMKPNESASTTHDTADVDLTNYFAAEGWLPKLVGTEWVWVKEWGLPIYSRFCRSIAKAQCWESYGHQSKVRTTDISNYTNDAGALVLLAECWFSWPLLRQFDEWVISKQMHLTRADAIDWRRETGLRGLRNQGATCYLNSLLQSFFHLRLFRRVLYEARHEDPSSSPLRNTVLNLQQLFFSLQGGDAVDISTEALTRSFGWETADAFVQHDVSELKMLLLEAIKGKLAGSPLKDALSSLFRGVEESQVVCPANGATGGVLRSVFSDLLCDVSGVPDLHSSLQRLLEPVALTGDNQWDAGPPIGKCDAEKRTVYTHFPPVLMITLKRFVFDDYGGSKKIHDRFEFPETIDMAPFISDPLDGCDRATDVNTPKVQGSEESKATGDEHGALRIATYAARAADPSLPAVYALHSILVHSGTVGSGHYTSYIRPRLGLGSGETGAVGEWFVFNDETVHPISRERAVAGNYGGGPGQPSAYMLVYIRERALPFVMFDAIPGEGNVERPGRVEVGAAPVGGAGGGAGGDEGGAGADLRTMESASEEAGRDPADEDSELVVYKSEAAAAMAAAVKPEVTDGLTEEQRARSEKPPDLTEEFAGIPPYSKVDAGMYVPKYTLAAFDVGRAAMEAEARARKRAQEMVPVKIVTEDDCRAFRLFRVERGVTGSRIIDNFDIDAVSSAPIVLHKDEAVGRLTDELARIRHCSPFELRLWGIERDRWHAYRVTSFIPRHITTEVDLTDDGDSPSAGEGYAVPIATTARIGDLAAAVDAVFVETWLGDSSSTATLVSDLRDMVGDVEYEYCPPKPTEVEHRIPRDRVLVFVRRYEPTRQPGDNPLPYQGRAFVDLSWTPSELIGYLTRWCRFARAELWLLDWAASVQDVEAARPVAASTSMDLRSIGLEQGALLVVQCGPDDASDGAASSAIDREQVNHPTMFRDWLATVVANEFRRVELCALDSSVEPIILSCRVGDSFATIAAKIASIFRVDDAQRIQFTASVHNGGPAVAPFRMCSTTGIMVGHDAAPLTRWFYRALPEGVSAESLELAAIVTVQWVGGDVLCEESTRRASNSAPEGVIVVDGDGSAAPVLPGPSTTTVECLRTTSIRVLLKNVSKQLIISHDCRLRAYVRCQAPDTGSIHTVLDENDSVEDLFDTEDRCQELVVEPVPVWEPQFPLSTCHAADGSEGAAGSSETAADGAETVAAVDSSSSPMSWPAFSPTDVFEWILVTTVSGTTADPASDVFEGTWGRPLLLPVRQTDVLRHVCKYARARLSLEPASDEEDSSSWVAINSKWCAPIGASYFDVPASSCPLLFKVQPVTGASGADVGAAADDATGTEWGVRQYQSQFTLPPECQAPESIARSWSSWQLGAQDVRVSRVAASIPVTRVLTDTTAVDWAAGCVLRVGVHDASLLRLPLLALVRDDPSATAQRSHASSKRPRIEERQLKIS